ITAIPLPFKASELVILLAFGSFLVLKALKLIRRKPTLDAVDFFLLLTLLMLTQAFIRNPTGIEVMNSDRIGGRPYVEVGLALIAYWVLSRAPVTPELLRKVIRWTVLALGADALLVALVNRIPSLGMLVINIYSAPSFGFEESATGTSAQAVEGGD